LTRSGLQGLRCAERRRGDAAALAACGRDRPAADRRRHARHGRPGPGSGGGASQPNLRVLYTSGYASEPDEAFEIRTSPSSASRSRPWSSSPRCETFSAHLRSMLGAARTCGDARQGACERLLGVDGVG
jgi:hypothetical protein